MNETEKYLMKEERKKWINGNIVYAWDKDSECYENITTEQV